VWQRYIPNRVLLLADGSVGQRQLTHWVPSLATVRRKQGRATAYICENYVCNPAHGTPADCCSFAGWVTTTLKVDPPYIGSTRFHEGERR